MHDDELMRPGLQARGMPLLLPLPPPPLLLLLPANRWSPTTGSFHGPARLGGQLCLPLRQSLEGGSGGPCLLGAT
jgi:hypothetical protein